MCVDFPSTLAHLGTVIGIENPLRNGTRGTGPSTICVAGAIGPAAVAQPRRILPFRRLSRRIKCTLEQFVFLTSLQCIRFTRTKHHLYLQSWDITNPVCTRVEKPFITGERNHIHSPPAMNHRIEPRWTKR
jgi:hypothetical protein